VTSVPDWHRKQWAGLTTFKSAAESRWRSRVRVGLAGALMESTFAGVLRLASSAEDLVHAAKLAGGNNESLDGFWRETKQLLTEPRTLRRMDAVAEQLRIRGELTGDDVAAICSAQ